MILLSATPRTPPRQILESVGIPGVQGLEPGSLKIRVGIHTVRVQLLLAAQAGTGNE